jgi:signal transduction histidine kinase
VSAAPLSLRRRVTIASALLGLLLSLLFSFAVVAVTEDYEHVLAAEILHGQAEDYNLRLSTGLAVQLPLTHRLSGYREHDVPARYAVYPRGVSEDEASDGIHVGVFDTSAGRLTFVIDLRDIERLERHLNGFLAGATLAGTAIAAWLGWWLAGTALLPLARLARAVDALPVQPRHTQLREGTSRDELGRIAGAIDAYQARLVEADVHEQAFFADASHELRTPIAVVQGAAEVLLDEPDVDPARKQRLQRLERGVQELADLLEAMLGIARRTPLQPEPMDAGAFLRQAAASALAGRGQVSTEVDATGGIEVARREATLLLRAVLRRLCGSAGAGTAILRLRGRDLELSFRGGREDAIVAGRTSDSGQMPAMALRLAQRLGWAVTTSDPRKVCFRLPSR